VRKLQQNSDEMLAEAALVVRASAMRLVNVAIAENDRNLIQFAAFYFSGHAIAAPDHVRNSALAIVLLPARERLRVCERTNRFLGDERLGHRLLHSADDKVSRAFSKGAGAQPAGRSHDAGGTQRSAVTRAQMTPLARSASISAAERPSKSR
jgi:hypothetical protein